MSFPAYRAKFDDKQADIEYRTASFGRNLARIQEEVWAGILNYLREFDRITNAKARRILLKETRANMNLATRTFETVQRILREEGYYREVSRFVRGYDDLVGVMGEAFEEMNLGLSFTTKDMDAMRLLKEQDIVVFRSIGADLSRRVNRNLFQSVMVSRSVGDVTRSIRSLVVGTDEERGLLDRHAATWADTALKSFDRQMTYRAGESAGLEYYAYLGPLDRRTRRFCAYHVGLTFHKSQIEQMDNGQIGPVMQYCGGYRCRHSLVPVAMEFGPQLRASAIPASQKSSTLKEGKKRSIVVFRSRKERVLLSKPQRTYLSESDRIPETYKGLKGGDDDGSEDGNG